MYQACINLIKRPKMGVMILGLLSATLGLAHAEAMEAPKSAPAFEEGKHYVRLKPKALQSPVIERLKAKSSAKVQVIEFFSYGCFACSQLHPILEKWKQAQVLENAIEFISVPVVFHKQWEAFAKTFYVMKELKKLETLEAPFLKSLYEQHLNLTDETVLKAFFVEKGVSEKTFSDLYHSFAVNSAMSQGNEISSAYKISESPAIVVNGVSGSYLLLLPKAGSIENLMILLNQIVSQELKK